MGTYHGDELVKAYQRCVQSLLNVLNVVNTVSHTE